VTDSQAPQCAAGADVPCRNLLPRLVGKIWRRLAASARKLTPDSPDEDFHKVRILAKRVRYASELAGRCLAPQTAAAAVKFAHKAEDIQNLLGEHQDTVIARAKLIDVASHTGEQFPFAFAVGRLAERQELARLAWRKKFFKAWKSFDKKGIRSWLSRRGHR
jgi:CHAD domain-containing protein